MKIGVISSTRVPQAMPGLPDKLKTLFRGMDIILHVGDVTNIATLKELENTLTITIAVSGDQDSVELKKYVEPKRVVEFSQRKIGMIHGDGLGPPLPQTWTERVRTRFTTPPPPTMYYQYLLEQFVGESVDAIVFGHTPMPYAHVHEGIFLFNPGAATPIGGHRPSVGVLEITLRSISGRFMYL